MAEVKQEVTLGTLWKQFLPLSLSDVTMAFGDPAITMTLAHLPNARANLAAVGVAKSLAIFFESPIIMLLHASNALAASSNSRALLWRFTLAAMGILTLLLTFLCLPPVFLFVAHYVLGIDDTLAKSSASVLMLMALWPAAIAWRRYYQGLLIRYGHGTAVGRAGLGRLFFVLLFLAVGYVASVKGTVLAGLTLVGGVLFEALLVTLSARKHGVNAKPDIETNRVLPTDMKGVWRFYWPLANSMLVVWGGRALLVGVIARAVDGSLSLAVWPAAWGLILLIANATRMVQQVIIRNRGAVADLLLFKFTLTVGLVCSSILLFLGLAPWGQTAIHAFVGGDTTLSQGVTPVILVCSLLPLLIAFQNAIQGFHIGEGKTSRVNIATWLGTAVLLFSASVAVSLGVSGATSAAIAMFLALTVETAVLALGLGDNPKSFSFNFCIRKVRKVRAT